MGKPALSLFFESWNSAFRYAVRRGAHKTGGREHLCDSFEVARQIRISLVADDRNGAAVLHNRDVGTLTRGQRFGKIGNIAVRRAILYLEKKCHLYPCWKNLGV